MISGTLGGNVAGRRAGFKPGNLPYLVRVIASLDIDGSTTLTRVTVHSSDMVGDANHVYFPKNSIRIYSDEPVSGSIDFNVLLNDSDLFSGDRTISSDSDTKKTPDQNTPQTAKSHKVELNVTSAGDDTDTLSIEAWPRIE